MALQIKRIYEASEKSDGTRLLVDRLWPRGISKARANLDGWIKEVTPSAPLRKWFGHTPNRFIEFSELYEEELDASPEAQNEIHEIIQKSAKGTVTLLYAAKDPHINHAAVLKDYIEKKMGKSVLARNNL